MEEYSVMAANTFRRTGFWQLSEWARAYNWVGYSRLSVDFKTATEVDEEMVSVGEETNDPQILCIALGSLAYAQEAKGEFSKAVTNSTRAIECGEACQNHMFRLSAGAALGRCYARIGDFERSIRTLKENDAYRAHHRAKGFDYLTTGEFFKTYLAMVEQGSESNKEKIDL